MLKLKIAGRSMAKETEAELLAEEDLFDALLPSRRSARHVNLPRRMPQYEVRARRSLACQNRRPRRVRPVHDCPPPRATGSDGQRD